MTDSQFSDSVPHYVDHTGPDEVQPDVCLELGTFLREMMPLLCSSSVVTVKTDAASTLVIL